MAAGPATAPGASRGRVPLWSNTQPEGPRKSSVRVVMSIRFPEGGARDGAEPDPGVGGHDQGSGQRRRELRAGRQRASGPAGQRAESGSAGTIALAPGGRIPGAATARSDIPPTTM